MRIAAVILGILGGLLAGVVGFFGYALSFGELTSRVDSFPALTFLAMLVAIIGAIVGIWLARTGTWMLAAATACMLAQAWFLADWSFNKAVERDQPLAAGVRDLVGILLIPTLVIALAALLSWRAGRKKRDAQAAVHRAGNS